MFKLALVVAMCSLSAFGVAIADSTTSYPLVVDRTVVNSDASGISNTAAVPRIVSVENSVFDVMRQRRLAQVSETSITDVSQSEVIVADTVELSQSPEAVTSSVPVEPLVEPLVEPPVAPINTESPGNGLYQRPDQRLGGASGSDTAEPIALEERNDSPRSITIYASDKAANILYERDAMPVNLSDGRLGIGFLFSESRDNVFTGNLLLDVYPDLVPNVRLSTGVRAYAALLGVENQDVVGVGLGVEGAYQLPIKLLPFEIAAAFFYTPDIFVFGQSDRIIDYNVNVGLQMRDSLHAFAGLRFLQFDTRPGDREVDDRLHVGLRWDFIR